MQAVCQESGGDTRNYNLSKEYKDCHGSRGLPRNDIFLLEKVIAIYEIIFQYSN